MIAVAISGGKDSTAALVRAVRSSSDVVGIFCDTGWESAVTYKFLKYLENRLNVKIVRISTWTLPDLIREKRKFPSARFRFCSEKLKITPTVQFLARHTEITEIWFGVRAEESRARSKKYAEIRSEERWNYSEWLKENNRSVRKELRDAVKHVVCRFPVVDWSEKDVFTYLKRNGIEPNPLYRKGFRRVGCFPCVMAGKRDLWLCWQDAQGKNNILLLAQIEKELNRKGYQTKLKPERSAKQIISWLKEKERQRRLFGFCSQEGVRE